jgi:(2R)-3-sulfolactate dehydrogenase (NADP+)
MPILTLAELEALVVSTLTRCRTDADNARSVARALVGAEAEGQKGHGLSRLPIYAAQAKVGKVDGFARPGLTWPRPAAAIVDAKNGFAYPAIDLSVAALPPAARQNGIAAAAITRSHHCGVIGHPVERLAQDGLMALMVANTPAAIAPWGGAKGAFGTNPIAFACPLPGKPPIVVDLSLSKARAVASSWPSRRAKRSPRAGRSTRKASRQRTRQPCLPAPCCRSVTPRAPRWP